MSDHNTLLRSTCTMPGHGGTTPRGLVTPSFLSPTARLIFFVRRSGTVFSESSERTLPDPEMAQFSRDADGHGAGGNAATPSPVPDDHYDSEATIRYAIKR